MAYLGRNLANLSDRVVLDSLTASATASYTLQLNSVNFVPSSAESLTVSLNGVIQAPISSYTVSGSTLTFASTLSASDSIDFIIAERGITLQTPSAGSVGTSQLASSAVTNAKIASDAAIATTKLGTGALLQVVSTTKTDTFTTSSSSFTDITGLSATITPSSTSSKILITLSVSIGGTASNYHGNTIKLVRGSTDINIGDASGSRTRATFGANNHSDYTPTNTQSSTFLDSPSTTSSTTYKAQGAATQASATLYINRWGDNDNDQAQRQRLTSSITLMEIAG